MEDQEANMTDRMKSETARDFSCSKSQEEEQIFSVPWYT